MYIKRKVALPCCVIPPSDHNTTSTSYDTPILPPPPHSVTTNGLGTPAGALAAARKAVDDISHYPPADFEPAISDLAEFLWPGGEWHVMGL